MILSSNHVSLPVAVKPTNNKSHVRNPEYIHVEKPIIDQLVSMGWQYMLSDKFNYKVTGRDNFKQVLLINRLEAAMTYKRRQFYL